MTSPKLPRTRLLVEAVGARRGGGYRQLVPILSELARLAPDLEITVFTLPQAIASLPQAPNIEYRKVNAHPRFSLRRLFLDFVSLPLASRRRHSVVITALNLGPLWVKSPHIAYQNDIRFFTDTELTGRRAIKRTWARQVTRAADAVIVPTRFMAEEIASIRRDNVHVIPLGADDSIAQPEVAPAKAEAVRAWIESPGPRLLAVATANSANKDLRTILEAMRLLKDAGRPVSVAITVDADDRAAGEKPIGALAKELGIERSVQFLGYCDRPTTLSLYRSADINVSASHTESFGFPLVEAAIESCPSICTDIPPSRELLGDAAIGYFEPGDAAALAVLVRDSTPGYRLSGAVSDSFRQRFSWGQHAQTLLEVIAGLS